MGVKTRCATTAAIAFVSIIVGLDCAGHNIHPSAGWSYSCWPGDLHPAQWSQSFLHCGGDHQSPIDIQTADAVYDETLDFFDMSDYANAADTSQTLFNAGGHTVEIKLETKSGGAPIYLRGGGLDPNNHYRLAQFHFHWGISDDQGSEHTVNGMHYPLELHLVHADTQKKASDPKGLAVVAFLFEVGDENPEMNLFIDHFEKVQSPGNEVSLTPSNILSFLPINKQDVDFFRYDGSLTTPPCYESVIWSVAQRTLVISHEQLMKFRSLTNSESGTLANNFRPTQPLNGRVVTSTSQNPQMSPAA